MSWHPAGRRMDDGSMSRVNRGPTGSTENPPARTGVSCGLTSGRGFGAAESPDPSVALHSRAEDDAIRLWSAAAHSQQNDSRVSDFPGQPVSWTLRAGGVLTCYHTSHNHEHLRIGFRTLTDTHEELVLQTTRRPGLGFNISPDGRFVVFDRVTHSESDIIGLRSPQRTL